MFLHSFSNWISSIYDLLSHHSLFWILVWKLNTTPLLCAVCMCAFVEMMLVAWRWYQSFCLLLLMFPEEYFSWPPSYFKSCDSSLVVQQPLEFSNHIVFVAVPLWLRYKETFHYFRYWCAHTSEFSAVLSNCVLHISFSRFQFSKEEEPSFQKRRGFADHQHLHMMTPTLYTWH
jgi:hypothetical protein